MKITPNNINNPILNHSSHKGETGAAASHDLVSIGGSKTPFQDPSVKLQAMARMTKTAKSDKSYAPEDRYLWDSWILKDDSSDPPLYRLFHLDAPKGDDPNKRHDQAQIRQAVSHDLKNWDDLGLVFKSGEKGSWDDGPIWTGNVYKKEDGSYLFFYTARNERDGQFQRIGLARSEDAVNWERSDKPLLEPDGRWYETTEESPVYKAWRDPEIIKDENTGKYLMYYTAKTKDGHEKYKGCIGLAISDEIDGEYEVLPPVLAPGKYAQMEVPQIIHRNDKVYLFFSAAENDIDPEWAKEIGGAQSGLHCFVGDSLTGPFEPLNGHGVVTTTEDNLYTVKLLPDPEREGEYVAIGWYMEDKNNQKAMTLSQPMPVHWEGDNIKIETGTKK